MVIALFCLHMLQNSSKYKSLRHCDKLENQCHTSHDFQFNLLSKSQLGP